MQKASSNLSTHHEPNGYGLSSGSVTARGPSQGHALRTLEAEPQQANSLKKIWLLQMLTCCDPRMARSFKALQDVVTTVYKQLFQPPYHVWHPLAAWLVELHKVFEGCREGFIILKEVPIMLCVAASC